MVVNGTQALTLGVIWITYVTARFVQLSGTRWRERYAYPHRHRAGSRRGLPVWWYRLRLSLRSYLGYR